MRLIDITKNKRLTPILLIAALIFTLLTGCSSDKAVSGEVVIIHTNDTHGRIIGNEWDVIGIDRVAAIHNNTPNSILIDAGDTLHGLPAATLTRGADIIELMNKAGYDAMTAGNHDFNYGYQRLAELRDMADFPILTSNVTKDGASFLDDTKIIEVDGIKIGLFGITTEYTASSAMPEYVRGLNFADPVETAREKANYLQEQGVHIIVAVCHMGSEGDRGITTTQIAEAVPEIDVIIDGHSHELFEEGLSVNGVLIAQTGEYGNNIGIVTITVEESSVTAKTASLLSYEQMQDTVPDEAVTEKLHEITVAMEETLSEIVGESQDFMSSMRAPGVRTQEMPLGSLVADAYREAAGAQIAVANGGDIRADINPGSITKGDIINILPFGNTLMVKHVTPAILRSALENGISEIVLDSDGNIDHENSEAGRYLQVSGFSFTYDPALPVGQRVTSITLDDGTILSLDDDMTQISLAGSNYVLTGGNDYTMLAQLPAERELGAADEALAQYINKHSPVTAPVTGRITEEIPEALDLAA